MTDRRYAQYGCGWSSPVPREWRNFDVSPTLRFERIPLIGRLHGRNDRRFPDNVEFGDIVRGLPVADRSFDGVYCSHVLEHLCLEDFRTALKNTYRILKPAGVFRLVMPDLERLADRYRSDPSQSAAHAFMRDSGLGFETRDRSLGGFLVAFLGNSRHRWLWDCKGAAHELRRAGFVGVRRARFGDCADARFQRVEEESRWQGNLGIECRRPEDRGAGPAGGRGSPR